MKAVIVALLGTVAASLIACGSTPAPQGAETPANSAAPVVSAGPTAAPAPVPVVPPDADGPEPIRMYPVAQIYSLIDLTGTDGTIELRLGLDQGGGTLGRFRYMPIVNGAPDIEQETELIYHADSTGHDFIELQGKRPNLLYHVVSGFRSGPTDGYSVLTNGVTWKRAGTPPATGLGQGLFPWSGDRVLEVRVPLQPPDSLPTSSLPSFRVVQGTNKQAPSLPQALATRLAKEHFAVETFSASRSGEVFVIGRLGDEKKIGTLVWRDKLAEPDYFVTELPAVPGDGELKILGGDTAASVRLRAGAEVRKLENGVWAVESTVAKDGLPDVWFGAPMVRRTDKGAFARLAAGAPWRPIEVVSKEKDITESFAVDAAGVIWKTEDDMLLSSREPAARKDITEEELVKSRKASVLRGGSDDVTGKPPTYFAPATCSMSYVLLASAPDKGNDANDFPVVREAIKGHSELAKARFIVTKERGQVLFGALIEDAEAARVLRTALEKKKIRGVNNMCANPPVAREIKIDLATGNVVK